MTEKMNEIKTKIIILLDQLPHSKRNKFFIAGKLNVLPRTIQDYLKIMVELEDVKLLKCGNETSYEITNLKIIEMAKETLVEQNGN